MVAGAVILPPDWLPEGLRDSKLLKAAERERLDVEIRAHAVAWGLAAVDPAVIDRINILQATLLATQELAGHGSPSTTMKYMHLSPTGDRALGSSVGDGRKKRRGSN